MRHIHRDSGFTLLELLLCLAAVALLLAVALPPMARVDAMSRTAVSLSNLTALGAAHAMYAFDWNGRQFTNVVDDLASYGDVYFVAYSNYEDEHGEPHPPVLLGWGCDEYGMNCDLWGYFMSNGGNYGLCEPIVFGPPAHMTGFGIFRIPNVRPFHDYVNGRFYGPRFYPPNDTVPYALVEPLFDSPYEFVPDPGEGTVPWWSSYCFSPAAMFNPLVMAHPGPGELDGWHNPWNLYAGFESPSLSHALYPDLKTQIIEHHWNQNAPEDPCNPNFAWGTYDGCEPYYFNHSIDSEPATLFYDMSTRLLPNSEVLAADEWMIDQVGYGLWSRDTPFGEDGYYLQYSHDGTPLSHHVLTTDGILGRDTLAPGCFAARREK